VHSLLHPLFPRSGPTKLPCLSHSSSFPPTLSYQLALLPSPFNTHQSLSGFGFFAPQTSSSLMGSISHVITTNPTLFHLPSTRSNALRFSRFNPSFLPLPPARVAGKVGVFAEVSSPSRTTSAIDFSDPDWKTKFKQDWEARFRLPHLTDIFPDASPIPSTFCLKMRFVGRSGFLSFLPPVCAETLL